MAANIVPVHNYASDKGNPDQSQGRKATGPRFLREATNDSPKDPKIAGLPIRTDTELEVAMSRVCKAMIIFGAMLMINVGVASDTNVESDQNRIGHLCFEETVKVANGVDPNSLSTAYCMRALRHEPLGREDR